MGFVIRETPPFTRRVQELLTDEQYRQLQSELLRRPDRGAVIPGGGGIRKMRWGALGKGKSGGVRVIYYWYVQQARIYMLLIYPKNQQDNLTPDQLAMLRDLVERG